MKPAKLSEAELEALAPLERSRYWLEWSRYHGARADKALKVVIVCLTLSAVLQGVSLVARAL